jgi:hypothetical protein
MGALQQLKSFAKLSRGTSDSGSGGDGGGGGGSSTVFAGRQRNKNSSSSSSSNSNSNYTKKKHSFETLQWRLEEAHLFWDRGESTQAIQLGKRIEKVARIAAIGGGGGNSQKQWNFEVNASMTDLTLLRAAALSSIGR